MYSLKITQVGNSLGVVLPRELLARMRLDKGSILHVTESPNGFLLTPYDPSLEEELKAGREFMREYRDAFHQLAK